MKSPSDITLGSFIGDALALGPHWIYDQGLIREKLGRVTTFQPPLSTYHKGKSAGDFTHYGDQTLVLLRSLAQGGDYDLTRFASAWQEFWGNPSCLSYRDGATKATLANLQSGVSPANAASPSNDIAGAARIGPLFLLKWADDDALLEAVKSQTAFTHGDPAVIEAAEFFARVVLALQSGMNMEAALQHVTALGIRTDLLSDWLGNAERSASSPVTDAAALQQHGLTCHVDDAFPGICHLLLRHPQDPATALIENVDAGGDSAARGMILGLVYGAQFPVADWSEGWVDGLHALPEIKALIQKLSSSMSVPTNKH